VFCLDTNVVIFAINGRRPKIVERLQALVGHAGPYKSFSSGSESNCITPSGPGGKPTHLFPVTLATSGIELVEARQSVIGIGRIISGTDISYVT